ncbi:hypothetical protein ACFFQW_48915 [Umezawaea endophytica]|uniref:Uncharacterized protein n=1 Tax=Umezawaea endophytica TaxID=1654476 RepID=A0A9X2VUV4_9PSEU|nr:hypothetical protein [Umezawaea endophytica]MCS7483079.1 hypothetical protein [Umezawaea endophytica]
MTEVEPDPESASNSSPQDPQAAPFDPQAVFAALSITNMEADVEALLNDRMGQLDEMLDGLDQLVARIEGEVNQFEKGVDPPQ